MKALAALLFAVSLSAAPPPPAMHLTVQLAGRKGTTYLVPLVVPVPQNVTVTGGGVGSSSNGQVLFNSGGAVAGNSGMTYDGTNKITIGKVGFSGGHTIDGTSTFVQVNLAGGSEFCPALSAANIFCTRTDGTSTVARSDGIWGWVSNTLPFNGTIDTAVSRGGAGVVAVGNGTSADDSGTMNAGVFQVRTVPAYVFVTGDFTTAANTNLQLITGLTWTMPGSKALNIPFSCHLQYFQATATAAVSFGIQDVTTAPTQINATGFIYTSTTVFVAGNLQALASTTATAIVTGTPSAITTIWNADLHGMIEQPSGTASAIQIMVKTAASGDAVTVKRGSFCRVGF